MNLLENSLRFNGYPIERAKKKLREIEQIPENEYQTYILESRKEIVNYHLENNSFYRQFVGKVYQDWESIPIMTKKDLQQPLENRLSDNYSKRSVYINKTSGSSGTPFIFAKDKFSHSLTWAEIISRFGSLGIDFNSDYQARFYGIPLDIQGYYKERIKDFFSRRYRFPVFDFSEDKLEEILNAFKTKKFDYINGYTNSIILFAEFLKEQNVILSEVCPSLRYCIVTSEMLFDDDKELLESAFNVPIINEYGASEMDLIAFTNTDAELQVNSRTIFVEILDDQNNPVQLGKEGRIIITSLYNKAHPMIRYEIGDIGVLALHSTYKKPILDKLIGRTSDNVKLPSGKIVPGLTFYYVTKSVISNEGNIKEFIIEQTEVDTFIIRYVANKELTQEQKLSINLAIDQYLEKDLKIEFQRTEFLKRSTSGKLKQFISLIDR